MSSPVTCRFRVRHYELDALGHLNNAVYVQHMQEAAIEGSTRAGYAPDWYRQRGTAWVIRRLTVRYLREVLYGDEIEIATWVSQMRGVSSNREYDLTRTSDGARVARARAQWVYVDLAKGTPIRFPPEFTAAFRPMGRTATATAGACSSTNWTPPSVSTTLAICNGSDRPISRRCARPATYWSVHGARVG